MSISFMQQNVKHVIHLMLENRSFDSLLGQVYSNVHTVEFPKHHVPGLRPGEQQFYGLPPNAWVPDSANYYTGNGPWNGLPIQKNAGSCCYAPPADPGEVFASVQRQLYGPTGTPGPDPSKYMKGFYLDYQANRVPKTGPDDAILKVFGKIDRSGKPVYEMNVISTLATQYALSDLWFSSVPTQTNPNRAFSIMGTSLGRIDNNDDASTSGFKLCGQPFDANQNTIFSVMNDHHRRYPNASIPATWKLYADVKWGDSDWPDRFIHNWYEFHLIKEAGGQCSNSTKGKYYTQYMFPKGMEDTGNNYGTVDGLLQDIANDALPSFCYVEPTFFPQYLLEFNSYHPPGNAYDGELFLKRVYDGLRKYPKVFDKTVLIVTFDEHGGTYDHLYPPKAPPPDANHHGNFTFDRYGVRVPTLFISPLIKPGTVLRPPSYYPEANIPGALPFDHTSVLKTLANWMGISTQSGSQYPLGARTAVAPSFDPVFSPNYRNPFNADIAVTPCDHVTHGCSPVGALTRAGIPKRITAITGHAEGTPEHQAIFDSILQDAKSNAAVARSLQKLMEQNGKTPEGAQ